jgi:phosphohistidine phosphatase
MVNLVIMRHGEAEPQYLSDSERQLTAAGQAEVSQMADWLHHHYSAFDRIFSSPYRRTQQTAAVLAQKVAGMQTSGVRSAVELNSDLVPEGNAQLVVDFLDMLYSENPNAKILLVSHMPLVSFLVEAVTRSGQTPIFDTAGVACIEYRPQRGMLLEYICPNLLNLVKSAY